MEQWEPNVGTEPRGVEMRLIVKILLALTLSSPAHAQSVTETTAPIRKGDPILNDTDRGDPVKTVPTIVGVSAELRALDKFTGERQRLTIDVEGEAFFQRMRINVRACYARISARSAEGAAFVQIYDGKEEPPIRVFSGWMFSNAPALSALDHPRYDIWVLKCNTISASQSAEKAE
jgi:hypothetical protein